MDEIPIATASNGQPSRLSRRVALPVVGAAALAAASSRVGIAGSLEATPAADSTEGGYVVIRRYWLKPGASRAELIRRIEVGFVPIIREVPGFVRYTLVAPGLDEHLAISVFADEAGADESTARAAGWGEREVSELVELPAYEVIVGTVGLDVAGTPEP